VLERALVRRDELTERSVVFAQHLKQFLGRGTLGERSKAAQVTEETGDVCAVSGQELFAVLAGDDLCHLRETKRASSARCRATASIRRALVRANRRLVGEGLDECDVVVAEGLGFAAHYHDDAD
jgi:hypothetical protein